jgi:hypothetical protein
MCIIILFKNKWLLFLHKKLTVFSQFIITRSSNLNSVFKPKASVQYTVFNTLYVIYLCTFHVSFHNDNMQLIVLPQKSMNIESIYVMLLIPRSVCPTHSPSDIKMLLPHLSSYHVAYPYHPTISTLHHLRNLYRVSYPLRKLTS